MFFYTALFTPRWRTRNYDFLFKWRGSWADGAQIPSDHQVQWRAIYNPTDRIRTNFQWLYTPTRQEGALYAYDGFAPNVSTRPLWQTALAQANDGPTSLSRTIPVRST
ncbi:MAG: hypothetical protein R2724_33145 [Bryobacterales bacterium]